MGTRSEWYQYTIEDVAKLTKRSKDQILNDASLSRVNMDDFDSVFWYCRYHAEDKVWSAKRAAEAVRAL